MIVVQRRLFWKIYLTLLASLVAVAVLMGAFWSLVGENGRPRWGAFHLQARRAADPRARQPAGRDRGRDEAARRRDGRRHLASTTPTVRSSPRTARRSRLARAAASGRAVRPAAAHRAHRSSRRPHGAGAAAPAVAAPAAAHPVGRADRRRRRRARRLSDHRPADPAARGPADSGSSAGARARCRCASTTSATTRSPWSRAPSTPPPDGRGPAEPRKRPCSPTPATNCARRCRACAWRSSCGSPSRAPDLLAEIKRNLAESDQLVDEILLASRLDHDGPTSPPGAVGRSHRLLPRRRRRASSRASRASQRAASRSKSKATPRCCAA